MKSVDGLVAEHDLIERGLAVLAEAVTRIELGESTLLRSSSRLGSCGTGTQRARLRSDAVTTWASLLAG